MKKKLLSVILFMVCFFTACGNTAEQADMEESIEMTMEAPEENKETEVFMTEPEASIESAEPVIPEPKKSEGTTESTEVSGDRAEPSKPASTPDRAEPSKPASTPDRESHSCTWDGGAVTTNATCTDEGVKTYTCSVCGSTKTERIAQTSHNYVTDATSATCTEAGKNRIYCSICGVVASEGEGEAAKGHTPGEKYYWPKVSGPDCKGGAQYNVYCTVCGEPLESGADDALPHSEVGTEIQHGNCVVSTVISYDCSICGTHIRNDSFTTDDHDWVTGEYDFFNVETLEWEKKQNTVCSRPGCSAQQ